VKAQSQFRGIGAASSVNAGSVAGGLLQRQCACGQHTVGGECEGCKKKSLQRIANGPGPGIAPPIVHQVLSASGRPLELHTRSLFESRFRHDFSHVRLHHDSSAAQSANRVNALAYTVGSHIVLGAGQYSPNTPQGRSLLAHELTHVVQQSGSPTHEDNLQIAPANDSAEREAERVASQIGDRGSDSELALGNVSHQRPALQRQGMPGTSTYQETATINPANPKTPGITEGSVERQEFGDKHALLGDAKVDLQFDENSCQVKIPLKVQYREPNAADLIQCPIDKGQKPTAMPQGKGRKIFDSYLSVVNEQLNGWFVARVGNCSGQKCADKPISIQVEVKETTSNPDYTVAVVNAEGRSCVQQKSSTTSPGSVVLVGDINKTTQAHEGSHMALGHGDEYSEPGKPKERVREDDFSLLASSDSYRGWAVLHERHFAFVPAFLKAALKGPGGKPCDAKLEELSRPTKLDFRVSLSGGYLNLDGIPGVYEGGGVSLGYAPGLRGTRIDVGAHFNFFGTLSTQQKTSFMLGLRVGIEKRSTPSSGGLRVGAYAEGGGAGVSATGQPSQWKPYAEGGATLGYGFSPGSGMIFSVFAEAAAGTTLDTHSQDNLKWFRSGIGAAVEF